MLEIISIFYVVVPALGLGEQFLKLLVQLFQSLVDIRKAHCAAREGDQFHTHSAGDLAYQSLTPTHDGVNGGEDGVLQGFLVQRGRVSAVGGTVVHPAGTAPHGAFLAALAPDASAVEGPALTAHQALREGILGTVAAPARGSLVAAGGSTCIPPGHLRLDLVELIPADDTLMIVLHQIHGELAHVTDLLLADAVLGEGLLHQGVAAVFLIFQNSPNYRDGPLGAAVLSGDIFLFQRFFYHAQAVAGQVAFIDPPHHLRLLRNDFGLAVLAFLVAVQPPVLEVDPSFPHRLPLTPADTSAGGFAFRLGEGAHHGNQQLTVRFQSVDVLLLEDDGDAQTAKDPHIVEAVHRVPCETGDRFDQDEVNFLLPALADHPQELWAFPG